MNTITFSHPTYSKFAGKGVVSIEHNGQIIEGMSPTLIQIFKCHYNDLSAEFLDYDAQYFVRYPNRLARYPVPKTELLVLIFKIDSDIFTTCRRWTPQKEKYYRSKIGEEFKIVIKEVKE